jgi:ATP-dependent protease ClpP protease subunit
VIVILLYDRNNLYYGWNYVDVTLLDVIKQVKQQSAAESFLVKIDSVGGYVDCGNDIYNYLKNLMYQ